MKKNNREKDLKYFLKAIKDPMVRAQLTKKNHFAFFHVYFAKYVTYPMADFHREIFNLTEDENNLLSIICAFRSSAKSTLVTQSYVLWSILGIQQKKFVVIVSQTKDQAKFHFKNVKNLLEENDLLKADLGPFQEENEWNVGSLVIPRYNARIMAVSSEQSIRGMMHGPNRPDLVICDDLEDVNSVKMRESRDKTYTWFNREILPLGDLGTKTMVVGNLLHKDSLIMRLKQDIEQSKRSGVIHMYPLIDEQGKCLWPGKYPTKEDIEAERLKIGNKFSWHQEYLLDPIDDREAVITEDMLHYYRTLPPSNNNDNYAIGIDLAISQKDTADYTAMVSARVVQNGDESTIYILPCLINERVEFPEMRNRIRVLVDSLGGIHSANVYVEEVAAQGYLTQQLEEDNFRVEGFKVRGMDKRTRVILTTNHIQNGKVLFPEHGAKALIDQLLDFGVGGHDDLVDAFTVLILKIIEKDNEPQPNIRFI